MVERITRMGEIVPMSGGSSQWEREIGRCYRLARCDSPSAACPAASRAVSTRYGEHDT